MLSYLTTAYQDHVRLREKFGCRVSDPMWKFFQRLGVIDSAGRPTEHFGQPTWVYLKYRRKKGDQRSDDAILAEGREQIDAVRKRGVFIAEGHGTQPWELEPTLDRRVRHLYVDSKKCIWAELPQKFVDNEIPDPVKIESQASDRRNYILHPPTGEVLNRASQVAITRLRAAHAGKYDVQIVVSRRPRRLCHHRRGALNAIPQQCSATIN